MIHAPLARALAAATLGAGALLGSVAVAGPAAARPHAAGETTTTPLSVVLTSLSPAAIPRKGVITLTGRVTNVSDQDWTEVNLAPFVSRTPITTREGLAQAAATEESVAVGDRLIDPATNAAVGDLGPGNTAPFILRVPVTSLEISGEPGVYWIGVHALGASAQGRDLVADGRARTFIPLVSPALAAQRSVGVSVVLPMRERVRRSADGRLNGPARWANLTAPGGRLARLVDFGASAGGSPLTWVVDPAALDALDDFARGNPALSLGPAERKPVEGTPSASPSASPTPSPSASATPEPDPGGVSAQARGQARAVLDTFLGSARSHGLFSVGYSDPDVASLARRRPSLIERADELAAQRMAARGLAGTTTVAPPDGYFDPELLGQLDKDTLVLLSDRGRVQDPADSLLPTGQRLVLTDARASAGGPSPTRAQDPLALRQRILSESALEVLAPSQPDAPRPMVVALPNGWNPGPNWRQADFFGGLQEAEWVRLAPVQRGSPATFTGRLPYGRSQLTEEVGDDNVAATRTLARTGDVLGHLLDNVNDVASRLTGAALESSSYTARPAPRRAVEQATALEATARRQLDRVQVTGTDFVVLSGGSGVLTVTLVNGLKQPITVGLRAQTDSPGVRVQTPEPISMGPGQRATRRLPVQSTAGVHDVVLYPVTAQAEDAGKPFTFSLRTSQVGRLIWFIIVGAGALLAVMIVRRIVLRIRNHRWREA